MTNINGLYTCINNQYYLLCGLLCKQNKNGYKPTKIEEYQLNQYELAGYVYISANDLINTANKIKKLKVKN